MENRRMKIDRSINFLLRMREFSKGRKELGEKRASNFEKIALKRGFAFLGNGSLLYNVRLITHNLLVSIFRRESLFDRCLYSTRVSILFDLLGKVTRRLLERTGSPLTIHAHAHTSIIIIYKRSNIRPRIVNIVAGINHGSVDR